MRAEFHRALDDLDADFTRTALLVADALPQLNHAFLGGATESVGDARKLAREVSERCRAVESRGFVLLAREAPVARDLRRLIALLRMVTDVERSASLLAHVSESLLRFDPRDLSTELRRQIELLSEAATDVFRRGVESWRRGDALAVNELDRIDEQVDDLRDLLLAQASSYRGGDEALLMGLVARYYERIADHGVALAQNAAFVVTGERVEVGN